MTALGISQAALERLMPDRQIRSFPALLSTEAEARRWAKEGAPDGALVISGYQASPRGRGSRPWRIPGRGIGFSVILRPGYLEHQEGRLYMAATMALSDLAAHPQIEWPDRVRDGEIEFGAAAVHAEIDLFQIMWAVLSMMLVDAGLEPEQRIASLLDRIEARLDEDPEKRLSEYSGRLSTIGVPVSAHLMPTGPTGLVITGAAAGVDKDGSLRVETASGRVVTVRPQDVGSMEVST